MTAVVGLALGRLRSSYTIITRLPFANNSQSDLLHKANIYSNASAASRLVLHSKDDAEVASTRVLNCIRSSLADRGISESSVAFGLLLETPSQLRVKNPKLSKLLELVSAEFPVVGYSFQDVRMGMGIKCSRFPEARATLRDMFTEVVLDRDDCGLNTGVCLMSESWGVARLADRQQALGEIRSLTSSDDSDKLLVKRFNL